MTLPKGQSSGRGRVHQSKACPPPAGAVAPPKQPKGLQRKTPLVARSSLQQGKPLGHGTPAQARPAFSTLKPGKSRRKRPGGSTAAGAWREQALERVVAEHGRLVDEVTGENLALSDAQVHHVLEAGDQWTRGVAEDRLPGSDGLVHVLVWHPDLTMVLHRRTHERHHARSEPIPRMAIRQVTWDLAAELDRRAGDGWWHARIETDYSEVTR